MKALILTLTLLAGVIFACFGQKKSVVVGTMINKPNAILVINPPNSDQGFLLPQLNTTQRLSIAPSSPDDDGLMVYDVTEKSFYYWSSNAWVKGLGDATSQILSYDAATQVLTLTGGGTVNLSTLKEIPLSTGNAGKYLTTDGTTLSWADINTIGDISSVVAGQGLNGGGTTGDINLSVKTDVTTINFNGSDALQVADGAITSTKLANDAVTSTQIQNLTITDQDIAAATITPSKIAAGNNNDVLVTIGGTVAWAPQSSIPLNVQTDGTTIAGDGSAGNRIRVIADGITANEIAANAVTQSELANDAVDEGAIATNAVSTNKIQDGAINEFKLAANSVTPTKIQPGANNQVLVTDGSGTTTWVNQSTLIPAIQTDGISIVGNGTAIPLAVGTITGSNITDNTLSGAEITDGSMSSLKITPGAANQMLVTNATGTATQWVNQTAPAVAVDGITIIGDGSGTPLEVGTIDGNKITDGSVGLSDLAGNAVNSSKVVDESLTSADILNATIATSDLAPDAVDATKILNETITGADILNSSLQPIELVPGANNQVLVTNGVGTVAWVNQSSIIPAIAVDGITVTGDGSVTPLEVGTIDGAKITDGTVALIDLAGNSVNSLKVVDESLTTADILNGTIGTSDLATDAVDATKILNETITSADVLDASLQPVELVPGANNQVLVTNGVGAVQWVNQSSIIPAIAVDGVTVTGDGAGTPLEVGTIAGSKITDGTVALSDLAGDAVNSSKVVDESLTTADILNATIETSDLAPDAVDATKILNETITGADILNSSLQPVELVPGANNQVLVTNGVGAVAWVNQSSIIPAIAVDGITVTGDGSATPLEVGTIDGNKITDGSVGLSDLAGNAVNSSKVVDETLTSNDILNATIATSDLAPDAVDATKILNETITGADILNSSLQPVELVPGANNQVLVTNGVGAVAWVNQSSIIPAIAVDGITVTGDGSATPLEVGTIDGNKITDGSVGLSDLAGNAVNSSKVVDESITTNDILNETIASADVLNGSLQPIDLLPGANNQVLVTNGVGTVQWVNQLSIIPAITTDGVTIIGNGAGTPLEVGTISSGNIPDNTIILNDMTDNSVSTNEIVDQSVTNSELGADAVTTDKIQAGAVQQSDIQDDAVIPSKIQQGGANQILATDGAGANTLWIDRGTLPSAGDVTGTLAATTVARIQGRDVTSTAPTNGQALIWNGTAWAPATVTVSPVQQYYSIDPSAFEALQVGTTNDNMLGFYQGNDAFVGAMNEARELVAPVNLPDGAVIDEITAFLMDNDLGSMTVEFERKPFTTNATPLASVTPVLVTVTVSTQNLSTIVAPADRIIDNSQYSYRIHVTMNPALNLDASSAALTLLRLYAIRIRYTK